MLTKLFSDNLIIKFKKIPVFVWYLIFGLTSFFATLYTTLDMSGSYKAMFEELYPHLNSGQFLYIFIPMVIVIDIVIFEFLAYLVYSIMSRRFLIKISQFDFVFKLRLTMILGYIIVGLISLVYFVLPENIVSQVATIGTSVINPFFQTLFLGMFIYIICKECLPKKVSFVAYSYIARFYLTIFIAMNIFNFALLFTVETTTLIQYIAAVARLIVYFGMIILAYIHYQKLKNLPPDDKNKESEKENEEDKVVFKDFGF